MKKNTFLFLLLCVALLSGFVFYHYAHKRVTAVQKGNVPINVQLQWFDGPQFLGFYVALEKGYYSEENLAVNLLQGGYTTNPIDLVRNGNADIGLATGDQVIIQFEKQQDIVAIGTVFRHSVACFLTRESDNISEPTDLVGKRVGVYRGFDTENVLLALLSRNKISPEQITIDDAGNLEAFLNGSLDAFPSYLFNEPIIAKKRGVKVNILHPEQFDVQSYSDTLIANQAWYKQNPEAVKRFVRATQRGWTWAKENPDASVLLMYKALEKLDRPTKPQELDVPKALEVVRHVGAGPRGSPLWMDPNRWQGMELWLQRIGRIKTSGLYNQLCDFSLANDID
jgi:ABC-type nitrate/sulfonate/bicarbonate transport system substrate-binding protein